MQKYDSFNQQYEDYITYEYNYNSDGLLTSLSYYDPILNDIITENYNYVNERLVSYTRTSMLSSMDYEVVYTYDIYGDIYSIDYYSNDILLSDASYYQDFDLLDESVTELYVLKCDENVLDDTCGDLELRSNPVYNTSFQYSSDLDQVIYQQVDNLTYNPYYYKIPTVGGEILVETDGSYKLWFYLLSVTGDFNVTIFEYDENNNLVNRNTLLYYLDSDEEFYSSNFTVSENTDYILVSFCGTGNFSYNLAYITLVDTKQSNQKVYHETTYSVNDFVVIKDYHFEETALNRLEYISLSYEGINLYTKNFDYYLNTTDVSNIEFTINNNQIKYAYQYDNLGNIKDITTYKNNILVKEEHYSYDEMNQLFYEIYDDKIDVSRSYEKEYLYDLKGNIIEEITYPIGKIGESSTIVYSTLSSLYLGYYIGYGYNSSYAKLKIEYQSTFTDEDETISIKIQGTVDPSVSSPIVFTSIKIAGVTYYLYITNVSVKPTVPTIQYLKIV